MRIKEGFLVREIMGQKYAFAYGGNDTLNGMVKLSGSGAFLWKMLEVDREIEELALALCNEYDVEYDVALRDVNVFLKELMEAELLV